MAITNSQQARQMYNQGGYADMGLMAPRQNYGLGSFVKKAVRGVKKIAKSPIGKAALLGGGAYLAGGFLPNGGGLMGGMSNFRNLGTNIGGLFSGAKTGLTSGEGFMGGIGDMFRHKSGDKKGQFSTARMLMGGLGATALAAPFLMGGDDDDDVVESVTQLDPNATVQSAKNYYSGMGDKGVGLNFMPKKKYVSQNFYAADGGRANYANGG